MKVQVGDRIVVEALKVTKSGRTGIVEEVLGDDPARLRVRWEDGHETIFSPSAGTARVTPVRRRAARAK